MSTEENKAIIRRLITEVWDQGNIVVLDEIAAADYVDHTPTEDVPGPERFKQLVQVFRTAFPDFRITIEDMIAEKDKVVARWIVRGTHKGDLMGIAPTGEHVTVTTGVGIEFHEHRAREREHFAAECTICCFNDVIIMGDRLEGNMAFAAFGPIVEQDPVNPVFHPAVRTFDNHGLRL